MTSHDGGAGLPAGCEVVIGGTGFMMIGMEGVAVRVETQGTH
jgi:hypothetical protein